MVDYGTDDVIDAIRNPLATIDGQGELIVTLTWTEVLTNL